MTNREKRSIRDSFAEVGEMTGPLASLFYGRLFELDPSIRPMFHGDIARQGRKLMDMLSAVVENLDRLETLTPILQSMGQRHAGYGVRPEHYRLVEEALLWSLGQALPYGLDEESRAAWTKALHRIAAEMRDGAASLREPDKSR